VADTLCADTREDKVHAADVARTGNTEIAVAVLGGVATGKTVEEEGLVAAAAVPCVLVVVADRGQVDDALGDDGVNVAEEGAGAVDVVKVTGVDDDGRLVRQND